jgi:hypothetical protein
MTEEAMSEPTQNEPEWVDINARMTNEVAWELAQFCKRVRFSECYELTEAHLPHEERQRRAYLMISGVEAVQAALRDKGYAPR